MRLAPRARRCVFLLIVGLGPILWMLKSAITPTQDTLRQPMALWPTASTSSQLATAWNKVHIDRYLFNTVAIAFGSWLVQIVVATTAGYALCVLRPRYTRLLTGLVLATLFVPPIVLLVPLYLTVVDVPIVHWRLIDSYWASGCRPGPARFNVILDEAVLRQPAARDLRGRAGRRRRAVPALLVGRPADVAADPRASCRCSR